MDKVVDIKEFHTRKAAGRARDKWSAFFPEELTNQTRLDDLTDATIMALARLDEQVTAMLYGVIMAVLDLGTTTKFQYMRGEPKIRVLDTNLFFIDQIRWELMRRLNWVDGFAGQTYPLVELIMDCQRIKVSFAPPYPELQLSHPEYERFARHRDTEGEAIVRGLIPAALAAFGERIKADSRT